MTYRSWIPFLYTNLFNNIIKDEQQGQSKAAYGKAILKNLATQLTLEFGAGFDERNLNNMRAFYHAFPIWNAVRTELSWTHYLIISRVENEKQRNQYIPIFISFPNKKIGNR